ncbi:biotin/lipoyl-containing protein [Roseovarius sp. 10]|uniref:acetyl-CoA carboxylase biotin carboxyl carrier protein n=1 Tax=Roseovarius sp. 10 TaxID=3080563 RepID=UPI0029559709|nr:biotin/lipoyl-containing protein [Roseovarius sp. 10]MDV7202342.1 biotin/lipoyl-containing protein [Roseovarius sp. 10]
MNDESHGGLAPRELAQILEVIEGSAFDSIELRIGDLHLFASKSGTHQPNALAPPTAPAPALTLAQKEMRAEGQASSAAAAGEAQTTAAAVGTTTVTAPLQANDTEGETVGQTVITAPVVGTFYIAPDPEASPFIDIGDRVTPETTVGLIEVMKTFIDVKAGCSGRITRRLVENTAGVEFGQRLFLVRSDTE